MPQFDLTPYLSQAFWMLLSFGFMYLIVNFLIFPMMDDVFSERDRLIKTNLDIAARVNASADKLIKDYNEFILSAEQQKAALIKTAYEQMHRTSLKIDGEQELLTREKITRTEQALNDIKNQLHSESDKIAAEISTKLAEKFYVQSVKNRSQHQAEA